MTITPHGIAEQAQALAAQFAEHAPADILAAFSADQQALEGAGVPAGVATPGSQLPDGSLLDAHGAPTTLWEARGGRPAVVVFYRGAWCPYCNIALRAYQQELVPALVERGVVLVAVSPQKPDGSLTTRQTNELTYAVVSDPGNTIAAELGILTEPSAKALAAQVQLGLDLSAVNADGTPTLPMPTTIVVDGGGAIRWIDVHPNYTSRTEVPEILAAVDALNS